MILKIITSPTILKFIGRHIFTALGAYLVQKGIVTDNGLTELLGALSVLLSVGHSAWDKREDIASDVKKEVAKVSGTGLIVALLLPALLLTGCTSMVNCPQGKILSVTERGLGFVVAQSPANQTPEVKFGFFSSTVVMIPTSTNGPTMSPNFANTFNFGQQGAFNLGIDESIASGNYQTLSPNHTNSAVTTQPVEPK